MEPFLSKRFLDIQETIECGFTLKRVHEMTRTYSQMNRTEMYSQHNSMIRPVWLNEWVFVYQLNVFGSSPVEVTLTSDMAPLLRKKYLDIQATIECGFTMKRLRNMKRTYSQMHSTDK